MPTVSLSIRDLERLLGKGIGLEELEHSLQYLKAGLKEAEGDEVVLETYSDRPDILSAEGVARSLKGVYGTELGAPRYVVQPASINLFVEESVLPVRPYISAAVVRGVSLDGEAIRQVMQVQEKLHETFARRRKKASIGVYNLDTLRPPVYYRAVPKEKAFFTPLDADREMTWEEVLRETPQGRDYGHLLENYRPVPLLLDSGGQVLSLPPIVNSEETRVSEGARNLFIDVTGLTPEVTQQILSIVATSLKERGGEIEGVEVRHPELGSQVTPDLRNGVRAMSLDFARGMIGVELSEKEAEELLLRARLTSRPRGGALEVETPPYRADLLHEVDLVEELAVFYGYSRIEPEVPRVATLAAERRGSRVRRAVRDLMAGLGFLEVVALALGNSGELAEWLEPGEELCILSNPVGKDADALRGSILPGLLRVLSLNTHNPLPQRVFECGTTAVAIGEGAREELRAAAAITGYRVSFEEAHSAAYSLVYSLVNKETALAEKKARTLIGGRSASILVDGREVGLVGEVSPDLLERLQVFTPVAVFEVSLNKLLGEDV